ncbi:MAG: hypothetical protein ACKOJ9_05100 [Actinomycetota bacterium]
MRRRLALLIVGGLLSACGGSSDSAATTEATTSTDSAPSVTEVTMAPTSTTVTPAYPMVRGSRYCELLFLRATQTGLQATVYGTQGLSYCPEADWQSIDAAAEAVKMNAIIALRNGPRGWLVDKVVKNDIDASERRTFGTLEMNRLAVVNISDPGKVGQPYSWQEVDRRAIFTFAAGSIEYFLVDPDGNRWIMQAFSQQVDPTIDEASLESLGERLALPEGWTYWVEYLDEDLVVDTMNVKARVLQDEFQNSYSFVAP